MSAIRPDAPWPHLEAHLTARLLPLEPEDDEGDGYSDYDLNPDALRLSADLSEAAVLVALVRRKAGVSVILTRRAETLARHSGQVAFPGGRIDAGENAVQAALREAQEEIGLDMGLVRPLGRGDAYETVTGFRVTPIVAAVEAHAVFAPYAPEVAEIFEAPFVWLMNPVNLQEGYRDMDLASEGGRGAVVRRRYYALTWEDRLIWGATAGMVRALRVRLFG